jgi:hypothetical protein
MSKFSTTMESAIDETEGNNDAAQATEKKKKKRKKSADDSGNEHGAVGLCDQRRLSLSTSQEKCEQWV